MSPVWDLPSPDDPALAGAGGGGNGTATGAQAARGLVGQFDLRFDPITGDFIDDGFGSWELVTTAETAVLHQLLCHYEAWWGDPPSGSRLHELELFSSDPVALLEDETRRAANVVVDAGLIADFEVQATEETSSRTRVVTSFRDVKTGQPVNLAVNPSGV